GSVRLDEGIDAVLDQARDVLRGTEFSEQVVGELRSDWSEGVGFARAFSRSMLRLLGKFGLVIIDPLDPAIKKLCSPIYARAISNADEIVAAIRVRSEKLVAAGYHAQVLV